MAECVRWDNVFGLGGCRQFAAHQTLPSAAETQHLVNSLGDLHLENNNLPTDSNKSCVKRDLPLRKNLPTGSNIFGRIDRVTKAGTPVIDLPRPLPTFLPENAIEPLTDEYLHYVCYGNANITPAPQNFLEAVRRRCKFLDAFYIFSLPESRRPKVIWTSDEKDTRLGPAEEKDWVRAILYHFLLATTTGSVSLRRKTNVPKVLLSDMGMAEPPHVYAEMLASFNIQRADGRWLTWLKIEKDHILKPNLMTRFWRPYYVFRCWRDQPHLPHHVNCAAQFCKKLASFPPSWDYHPVTSSKAVEDMIEPVIENTWGLMQVAFPHWDLSLMSRTGVISSSVQVEQPEVLKWTTWDPAQVIEPKKFIFSKKT